MAPRVMNLLVSDLGGNRQTALRENYSEGVRGDPAGGTHQENLQSDPTYAILSNRSASSIDSPLHALPSKSWFMECPPM